jgi:recombination protein RecT
MATQLAERRADPVTVIRQNMQQMAPEFKAALPAHISVEKFTRVAMTAISNNPDLQQADRRSLFGAVVRLAQDGLLPDGREAAIVLFNKQAQAMPMIAGILKKVRQSGEISYISAHVVYSNDKFKWTLGFDENVEHEPAPLDAEPGEPVAAYAVAVLKDGSRLLEVMRKAEIEKVRNVSRAKGNGPWVQWWSEMARKTVMRRLSKRLPMSTDLDDAFDRDATMQHANAPANAGEVIDMTPQPMSRLDAIEQQIEDQSEQPSQADQVEAEQGRADADTGEVTTLASAQSEIDQCELVPDVNARVSALLPLLGDEDADELRNYAADKIAALKVN